MIRYRLQCSKQHEFEAWFGSSTAYDGQVARGQITCPDCGSSQVCKTLMSPGIATRGGAEPPPPVTASQAPVSDKQGEMQRQFLSMLQNVRREVEKSADYVGPRFAEEARKIHHEEVEPRGIWGEATLEQARQLSEEGIDVLPLPRLPKDTN